MKRFYQIIIVLSLVFNIVNAQTFSNPISDLADPHIVHYEGYYYCTGTTGWSVGIKKAVTLEGLKSAPVQHIYNKGKGGPCCAYWAPEIHRIDGKWYIYYTASATDGGPQHCYVIENSDDNLLSNNWVDKGRIFDSENDVWAIDGTVFTLNGTLYYVYSAVPKNAIGDKPQRIFIGEMTNPWSIKPGRVLLSSPHLTWEMNGAVNEAPEVIQRNGKVFIIYSANGCWTSDYILGMLSMDASTDPMLASSWHKHMEPVFRRNDIVQAYAPGHHCFFTSPDGTEDWIAYHATTKSGGACDNSRTVRAQRMYWDSNGDPYFGMPMATGVKLDAPSGEPNLPIGMVLKDGIYKIISRVSGKSLDVEGCSQALGANVQQWNAEDAPCQKWIVQATSDGNYTINSVSGGLSLDVSNCSFDDGANIGMWVPNGANCQLWRMEKNSEGYYFIISKNSNKALSIENGSTLDGANVIQKSLSSDISQQFAMELVNPPLSPPNGSIAWESFNMRGKFIRHSFGRARIDNFINNVDDAYWIMVPGLAGEGVSFQSINLPDNYLRHRNGEVWLDVFENTNSFKGDATFYQEDGLAHFSMVSFRSYNMPNHYIRHRTNLLYVETLSDNLGRTDATFLIKKSPTTSSALGLNDDEMIFLHPNPTSGILYISGNKKNLNTYVLYDSLGRMMDYIKTGVNQIDISSYEKGFYFVKIFSKNSSVVRKIIKE